MTVKEMIEALSKLPQDAVIVRYESCCESQPRYETPTEIEYKPVWRREGFEYLPGAVELTGWIDD